MLPHFGGRRLAAITTADVNAFILKRQKDVMVVGEGDERQARRYSNGEINRELTTLKRILNLARQNGKLVHVPHIPMLKERNVRTGFSSANKSTVSWLACRCQFGRLFSLRTSPAGASQARC